jgi:dTDP-4-dehydrorhamnose reductase
VRILITGASGMLGTDLQQLLEEHEVTALGRAQLDVTDARAVDLAVSGHDAVVNAAAYTKVDDAETNRDQAEAVNATAAGLLAEASERHGARLVQVSTDYVFDGHATEPYAESAPLSPLSVYGATKARGERLALAAHPGGTWVLRTAWLYGAHGPNFVSAVLGRAATHERLSVLSDNRGQPSWTMDVAAQIVEVIEREPAPGVYHATNSGETSRFDFAREILRLSGLDPDRVDAITGDDGRAAPRPGYSVLGHGRWAQAGIAPLRPWQDALADYLAVSP